MFWSHYGFRESPFGVTPDPRYLYATATHREALASLLYGINSGLGFMTLIALPGMGKTTILFEVLSSIRSEAVTAFLFQPVSTPVELLRVLLAELGVPHPQGGLSKLQMQLNELLLKHFSEGKRVVVAIDEAQSMNDAVLEQVRMLSNFETSREKFMQIILAGQPQLAARLASPELLQLRQRISIAARLDPLSPGETATYISHRLTIAGHGGNASLFNPSAVEMIAQHSEGIPRNINNLCFNSLALACALRQSTIGPEVVREVIEDLDLKPLAAGRKKNKEAHEQAQESVFATHIDKPDWQAFLVLKALPLVCVLALVFGFVYLRFLGPSGRRFHFENPVGTAGPAPAPDPGTPEAKAGSETSDPLGLLETSGTPASEAASADAPETPTKTIQTRTVRVRRGQTLHNICAETFRDCGPGVFHALLEANPGISNPNLIVAGQKILLPSSPPYSASRAKH